MEFKIDRFWLPNVDALNLENSNVFCQLVFTTQSFKETPMKPAEPSKLSLRSILIASHLCVCSLSIAVTLAILNVHPVVGLLCLLIAMFCPAFILKKLVKQYAFRKLDGTIRLTNKNGKIHVDYLKSAEIELKDSPKE
jgi:hypothetical protein